MATCDIYRELLLERQRESADLIRTFIWSNPSPLALLDMIKRLLEKEFESLKFLCCAEIIKIIIMWRHQVCQKLLNYLGNDLRAEQNLFHRQRSILSVKGRFLSIDTNYWYLHWVTQMRICSKCFIKLIMTKSNLKITKCSK